MTNKLPLIELTNRWIDIFTYFHYPENIREEAFKIAYKNQNIKSYPHIIAASALYIACVNKKTKFDFKKIRLITQLYRQEKNIKSGLRVESIRQVIKKWKL